MNNYVVLIIGFLLAVTSKIRCKYVEKRLDLKRSGMEYVTKFTFSSGSDSLIEMNGKSWGIEREMVPEFIYFGIVSEYKWDLFMAEVSCKEKLYLSEKVGKVNIARDNKWSKLPSRISMNISKPVTFFIYAFNCENDVRSSGGEIEVKVTMKGHGGTEFSLEEESSLMIYSILSVCLIVAIILSSIYLGRELEIEGNINSPILIVFLSTGAYLGSIASKLVHLWIYAGDGRGWEILNLYSIISQILAELILSLLLIQVSRGWTIDYKDISYHAVYLQLYAYVMLLHIFVALLTHLFQDDLLTHHDYSGYRGLFLLFVRLSLLLLFLYGIRQRKLVRGNIRSFLNSFALYGTLYFISFPILILISNYLPVSSRYIFLLSSNAFLQGSTIWALYWTFSSKTNLYSQISTGRKTILPVATNIS